MDQIKIGKFIATVRKEHSLTQRRLADLLNISDKTISKWETGNGLPEVSLMMPLCEALGITVNELLSGERLSDSEYKKKAEENIIKLIKEKEESKKKIILSAIVCFITILAGCTLIVSAGYIESQSWVRFLLIAIALVVIISGIGVACVLDMQAGTFECPHCKARFVPTAGAYIAGPHTLTKRYLKCPECGKKSYCKKKLTH
ncbi:MAG: helix-turn-helix domain-containing protein [Eubacterium sp.]